MIAGENYIPTPQERLRTALGVNRTAKVVRELLDQAQSMPRMEDSQRGVFFQNIYEQIHREGMKDTHAHSRDPQHTGLGADVNKRIRMREVINHFADQFFDTNGYLKSFNDDAATQRHEIATHMAELYIAMRDLRPFAFGNEIALNAFIDYFGKLPGFEESYGTTIDMRRIGHDDASVLRTSSDRDALTMIFEKALDPTHSISLKNQENEYGVLDDRSIAIDGINFLSHKEGSTTYIVTVNGGLVEAGRAAEQIKQHFAGGGNVAELYLKPEKFLDVTVPWQDMDGKSKLSEMRVVDGYEVREDKAAPPVCLDADIRTGLRKSYHNEVIAYLKSKGSGLYELNNRAHADILIGEAPEKIRHVVGLAARHLQHVTPQIDHAKDELFEGKVTVAMGKQPQLIFSMGGPGSGKQAVDDLAEALTGDNYVEASLDKARSASGLYHLLTKVGHHAGDYALVEPFAIAMREWTANKALGEHFNLKFDGTGIDFNPRYEKRAKTFKDQGYHVSVCMVDSMLVAPKGREAECGEPVIKRIYNRLHAGNDQRALPWQVTVGKHRKVMESFLDAWRSPQVDKVMAFCSDGPKKARYLLAESFKLPDNEFHPIENKRGEVGAVKASQMLRGDDSALFKMAQYEAGRPSENRGGRKTAQSVLQEHINRIPAFEDKNISMLCDDSSGENRGLLITNVTRMVDLAQKNLLNPHASGPSNLLKVSSEFGFLVPGNGKHVHKVDGEVALQMPSKEYRDSVARKYAEATQSVPSR